MDNAVDNGECHDGITQNLPPIFKVAVRGNDDRGFFIPLPDDLEKII